MVARYLPHGQLDPSFGEGGTTYIQPYVLGPRSEHDEANATAVAIQPDGKILVGGTYDPDLSVFSDLEVVLAHLNADGSIDTGFGGTRIEGGQAGQVIGSAHNSLLAITLQGKKILVGGEGSVEDGYVARYNPDGTRDKAFASGHAKGVAHLGTKRTSAGVTGLIVLPNGKIYAAGYLNANLMLARLNRDGTADRGFGKRGLVTTNAAKRRGCGCSVGTGLARDRHGRLLVSGFVLSHHPTGSLNPEGVVGARAIAVARYRPDGSLDKSFGGHGVARTSVGTTTYGGQVAVQRDGRIVVAGAARRKIGDRSQFTVVRYLPNGRRDLSFFGDGIFMARLGALSSYAWSPIVDGSGRIAVAGGASVGPNVREGEEGMLVARFTDGAHQ